MVLNHTYIYRKSLIHISWKTKLLFVSTLKNITPHLFTCVDVYLRLYSFALMRQSIALAHRSPQLDIGLLNITPNISALGNK